MKKFPVTPNRLKSKDKVAIISTASPFDEKNLNIGKEFIISAGWIPVESTNLRAQNGYLCGEDIQRSDDLNSAFKDDSIKAIFCARGGYGSIPLINLIDWNLVEKFPKIFVGFSDITALMMCFLKKTGLATISAPMPAGTQISNMTLKEKEHYIRLLSDPDYQGLIPGKGRALSPGKATGPLIGGNLTLLVHCLAGGILPDLMGAILLIEDVNEPLYRIDRALATLKLSGAIGQIAGVVAGEFISIESDQIDIVLEKHFKHMNIPLISGFPVGHGKTNVAVPIGTQVLLDGSLGTLHLKQNFVKA